MDEKVKVILKLIQDEIEAIEGYKCAIKTFCDDKDIADKLAEIMRDESEHAKELSEIIFKF